MGPPQDTISASEVAQYDRQIRLWGLDAQKRLLTSEVVFLSLRGCYVEAAKNLVLAGIGRIRLQCHRPVTKEDLEENYYLRQEDIGKPLSDCMIPRLEEMNSFIKITAPRTDDLGDIVFTDDVSTALYSQCVKEKRIFFLSRCDAEKGFFWTDNGESSLQAALSAQPTNERERLFQEMCKDYDRSPGLITTNAVLGGLLAQEALKVLMQTTAQLDNLITFSHADCATYVDRIPKREVCEKEKKEPEEVFDLDD